jgi:hypothetical protein
MIIDKNAFSDSGAYAAAVRAQQSEGLEPVDPKLASLCLDDRVTEMGGCSENMGACAIEGCVFQNDKVSGVSGFCLKQEVGVSID